MPGALAMEKVGTGASVSHTFLAAGSYLVSLTVTDTLEQTHESIAHTIVVEGDKYSSLYCWETSKIFDS